MSDHNSEEQIIIELRKKLEESEANFRFLFDESNDAITISSPEGELLHINQAGIDLFEYNKDEIFSINPSLLYHDPSDQKTFQRVMAKHGLVKGIEIQIITKNNIVKNVITLSTPRLDQNGKLIAYQTILRDITEIKQTENALRESEERFRSIVDTQSEFIVRWRPDGARTFVNDAYCKYFGITKEQAIGTSFYPLIKEEFQEIVQSRLDGITLENPINKGEHEVILSDGSKRWNIWTDRGIFDESGKIIEYQSVGIDITEMKIAEEALRTSGRKYRDLVETSQNLIWKCDELGRFTYLNPAWEETHGYALDEMIGKSFAEFQRPEIAERDKQEFASHIAGGRVENYRTTQITKSGKQIDLVFNAIPIKNDKGEIVGTQGTASDITNQLKAERELIESETKYRNIAELTQSLIWRCDSEGNFTYLNPAWEKVLGYGIDEMIGKKFTDFKDQTVATETFNTFLEILENKIELNGFETQYIHKNGDVVTLLFNAVPLVGSIGEVLGTQGTAIDITDRLKAENELQTTREQLFHAQKMEAVGRLAGGIAHDFNNMLTLITLNAEILASKISSDNIRYSNLQNILDAISSATKLTGELLLFSRKRKMEPEIVKVNEAIKKHFSTFGPLISKNIKQVLNLDPISGNIYIDRNHLENMILNLVINAVDAMPQGGILTIETKYIPENYILYEGKYNTKQLVEITVKDTGVGMTEEVKKRIFEPFFSTKDENKGTGLGLSTIYHIIQQSDGFIKVESEISIGTAFSIYLPKMDPLDLKAQREFESTIEIIDRSEHILLIDDDNKIRSIIKEIITMGGFEVLDASNAFDALRILNENVDNINLVISDVVMPDLSGKELVKQILQIKPSIKVLYVTGDSKEFESISNNLKENMDILLKPFNSDKLISKLTDLNEK